MSTTRRQFVVTTAMVIAGETAGAQSGARQPWYRRCYRWGQTNITEKDPARYDIGWWRGYWKRTRVQGIIVNAGGIVAYYPSRFPLHKRAEFLGDRDLFGDLTRAAHEDGLAVLARMDCNRTAEDFYRAHPDWFARNAQGEPYRAADKYVTCIFSNYYQEYIPGVLREIAERYKPEGFTDNSWAGLGRSSICYCGNCTTSFRAANGKDLPRRHDWGDPVFRQWIEWNYARRLEIWDLYNRTTQASGGADCVWAGMNSGSVSSQARSFRDLKEVARRAHILMLDHQRRSDTGLFQQNTDTGKLVHGLMGWDKIAPESMAMYQSGGTNFRVAAKPAAEARMWMIAGFAGGISPWWHHVGAYHEDRRAYKTAEPVMRWHEANERYLGNRTPVAAIGVVWSQRNTDFFGRDNSEELVDAPYRGMVQALVRARIPYIPVNADHVGREGPGLAALVLPNVGAMSPEQASAVRRFVEGGGGLLATGASTLYDHNGDPQRDFALADLFGAHIESWRPGSGRGSQHTYLRLSPELRARVDGPKAGDEPAPAGQRHAVLRGFDETDLLPYGGALEALRVDPDAIVPLTFVSPFPVYPPETAWMRAPKTNIPGLVLREGRGRVAYLPADIDRRYGRENLPDHGDLLANLLRWVAKDNIPLAVEGRGLIDCNLYRQPGRVILHLVNLTSAGTWRAPIDELIPVGPLAVRVRVPRDVAAKQARFAVSGAARPISVKDGWVTFEVPSVLDHEMVVIG
ncbi:MAG: beta-galactosidase [Acidobacteria bacterium]|nr:beta-galactosidase [Acidobacteriota bacterium]